MQYTSRISEYVEEFVNGKDVQTALCVYPSKMADWQVKCKNKLLIRNEIKKTIRNRTNSSAVNCHAASLPLQTVCFPRTTAFHNSLRGCYFHCHYCCGVHVCYKVCYCCGVHML